MKPRTAHTGTAMRSTGAVLAGFIVIVALSTGADALLHALNVFPPWDVPMTGTGLFLLAFAYRFVFSIAGCYLAARLAPRNPMRHALALGVLGLVVSTAGVIATIVTPSLGPLWYPIALVLICIPCALLGGGLYRRRERGVGEYA